MKKSNLVLLESARSGESIESKTMEGIKYGMKGIVEAQSIMRKKMSKKECDVVVMKLLLGSFEIIRKSFDLQPGEIDRFLK